ncbi:hypothetical protein [Alteromonas sp. a30]|uniref:hypothetical protein n=1 Tax=Alteromonas sp. a30 TaxID=2730917 RepID=UPI002282B421|nr:hypothetical protein [Alteromonas sp. a30]MCY7297529.1 hypothetical protein [Alteromonas sp. a30]
MFDSKYIITTIISLLLVAAWQKPSLYKQHLSTAVISISVFFSAIFFVWTIALNSARKAITEELAGEKQEAIINAINSKGVSETWGLFVFCMIFVGGFLAWLADISEKHDKERTTNKPDAANEN